MKKFLNNKQWIGMLAGLTYTPLEPLPGATTASYASLSAYLNLVFNILLSIGGMIAVVTLVLGGITYMVSEIVDKKSEAKKRMQAAIIGLLLLLSCWLILHEINPNLTSFSLPGIDTQSAQPSSSASSGTQTASPAQPTQAQIIACEGAEVPTGKHLTSSASGYTCQ